MIPTLQLGQFGLIQAQGGPTVPIIDDMMVITQPGGANSVYVMPYSVSRRLTSSYPYSLFRVRRSSDNAEQDIGFDPVTNWTDVAALTSFVGANDGFVSRIYWQYNTADPTMSSWRLQQTTAASQPKIVDAGTPVTVNGRLACLFDGVDDSLNATVAGWASLDTSTSLAVVTGVPVYVGLSPAYERASFGVGPNGHPIQPICYSDWYSRFGGGGPGSGASWVAARLTFSTGSPGPAYIKDVFSSGAAFAAYAMEQVRNGTTDTALSCWRNGVLDLSWTVANTRRNNTWSGGLTVGRSYDVYSSGHFCELIYNSIGQALSTDQPIITNNQMAVFGLT